MVFDGIATDGRGHAVHDLGEGRGALGGRQGHYGRHRNGVFVQQPIDVGPLAEYELFDGR